MPLSAPAKERWGAAAGLAASLALHAGLLTWVSWSRTELDFELTLPDEVEIGLTEDVFVVGGDPAGAEAPPAPAPAVAEAAAEAAAEAEAARDAGARGPRDAGVPDAGGTGQDLVAEEEGAEGEGGAGGGQTDETRLPAGAQIALRLDMERIRGSSLAPDVRRVLGAVPDWQAVLEGSGIEPLDDLDRVLIASPNLQRSRMVLAGRYVPDRVDVRAVIARMAAARGTTAEMHREHGVEVAPWANADDTERVIALVGPRHFTITRPEDLPRVLAIASARAEREQEEADPGHEHTDENPTEALDGPDALLSMGEGEALSLEVEGARQFVRGQTRGAPARLRVAVTERDGGGVAIDIEGHFDSDAEARDALDYWSALRDQASRDVFVAMTGMASTLRGATLEVDGSTLRGHTTMSASQIRLVLSFVESTLARQARRQGAPSPTPSPSVSPTATPTPRPVPPP